MDKKDLLRILVTITVLALAVTVLSAFLPVAPFTISKATELSPLKIGFPVAFVDQKLDAETISALTIAGIDKQFILPRYDKFESTVSFGHALLSFLINAVLVAGVYLLVKYQKPLLKKALPFLLIGALITVLFMFMPVAPGTFKTIDDLDPMRFGFPIAFVEQTPDVNTIVTDEGLYDYLKQSFIAPNYGAYTTYINPLLGLLSWAINSAGVWLIAQGWHLLRKKVSKKA